MWNAVVINFIPSWRREARTNQLPHTRYLATIAYPLSLSLFGFPILSHEKALSCTVVAKEELTELHHLVRDSAAMEDRDLACFANSQGNTVPWSKVEGYT